MYAQGRRISSALPESQVQVGKMSAGCHQVSLNWPRTVAYSVSVGDSRLRPGQSKGTLLCGKYFVAPSDSSVEDPNADHGHASVE